MCCICCDTCCFRSASWPMSSLKGVVNLRVIFTIFVINQACECLLYPDCKWTQLGREYTGTLNTTVSGKTCQAWSSDYPHAIDYHSSNDDNYPEGNRADAKNYCRNPDSDPEGLWCYTTDPNMKWETCDVPLCNGSHGMSTLSSSAYVR